MNLQAKRLADYLVFRQDNPSLRPDRASNQGLVQIARGAYFDWGALTSEIGRPLTWWEAERVVAAARLYVLDRRLRGAADPTQRIRLTAEAALIAAGAEPWNPNPEIKYRRGIGGARTVSGMPAVLAPTHAVAARPVRRVGKREASDIAASVTEGSGLIRASNAHVVADLVASLHPLVAFVDVALFLRHLSGFDKFERELSAGHVRAVKEGIDRDLQARAGAPYSRLQRDILAAAPASIDSPGEAVLFWMLRSWLPPEVRVVSQQPVTVGRKLYFLDLTLPDFGYAFEFDGSAKMGADAASWRRETDKFLERQQDLQEAGWVVMRVSSAQLRDLSQTFERVGQQLARAGVRRPRPGGPLWKPL